MALSGVSVSRTRSARLALSALALLGGLSLRVFAAACLLGTAWGRLFCGPPPGLGGWVVRVLICLPSTWSIIGYSGRNYNPDKHNVLGTLCVGLPWQIPLQELNHDGRAAQPSLVRRPREPLRKRLCDAQVKPCRVCCVPGRCARPIPALASTVVRHVQHLLYLLYGPELSESI